MNPQPSWRDLAIERIASAVIEYAELYSGDIDPQKCRKWISANRYPFGVKNHLPYRIWCEESRKILSFFEAYSDPRAYRRKPQWFQPYSKECESPGESGGIDRANQYVRPVIEIPPLQLSILFCHFHLTS
jgi:hypothetical protein